MGCYNTTPLKRSFVPETLPKEREGKHYTSGSQHQVVCPFEALSATSINRLLCT